MRRDKVVFERLSQPHIRVIRGFDGIVRQVDVSKAREAMKHAMIVRESRRVTDEERNIIISSHATR
jgi:hypothetical protein